MKSTQLSVVVMVLNREQKIKSALESVKWASEIIVLDGGSTDNTVSICREYTDIVLRQPEDIVIAKGDNMNLIRNKGFEIATCPWILSLDSDEVVSGELADEMRFSMKRWSEYQGFFIPRKNYYWGHAVRLLQPDLQLRLFQRGKARFTGNYMHDQLELDGSAGFLKNSLVHSNYDSISDFINRAVVYSRNEARFLREKKEVKSFSKLMLCSFGYFYYYYLKQEAFKDGYAGFIVSLLYAWYHFLSYARFFLMRT